MGGVLVLINKHAGDLRAEDRADRLVALLAPRPVRPEQVPRVHDAVGRRMINDLLASGVYDLVVVIGGDGTLNDVVNLLDPGHLDVPIAFLGTGTVNVFSRALDLPRRVEDLVDLIATGAHLDIPVAEVRTLGVRGGRAHRWIMFCEAGFLADSMVRVNRRSGTTLLAGRRLRALRKRMMVGVMSVAAALGNRGRPLWLNDPTGRRYADILLVRVREYGGMSVPIEDCPTDRRLGKADFAVLGFRSLWFPGHLTIMTLLLSRLLGRRVVRWLLVRAGILDYLPGVPRAVIGESAPRGTARFVDAETLDLDFPLECDFTSGLRMRAVVPSPRGP